jgi:hypothetical protein
MKDAVCGMRMQPVRIIHRLDMLTDLMMMLMMMMMMDGWGRERAHGARTHLGRPTLHPDPGPMACSLLRSSVRRKTHSPCRYLFPVPNPPVLTSWPPVPIPVPIPVPVHSIPVHSIPVLALDLPSHPPLPSPPLPTPGLFSPLSHPPLCFCIQSYLTRMNAMSQTSRFRR